jgi:hypothetical protein
MASSPWFASGSLQRAASGCGHWPGRVQKVKASGRWRSPSHCRSLLRDPGLSFDQEARPAARHHKRGSLGRFQIQPWALVCVVPDLLPGVLLCFETTIAFSFKNKSFASSQLRRITWKITWFVTLWNLVATSPRRSSALSKKTRSSGPQRHTNNTPHPRPTKLNSQIVLLRPISRPSGKLELLPYVTFFAWLVLLDRVWTYDRLAHR